MIYTDMEHLDRYRGICPQLDTAIGYLREHGLKLLVLGHNEVDGEDVFVNRFHYTTMPQEETAFEAHEVYADIHLLVEGREYIGVTSAERLTVTKVNHETDNIECHGPVETKIPMEPGKVLIVFPEDAHMVKIEKDCAVNVEKAVVKVRV